LNLDDLIVMNNTEFIEPTLIYVDSKPLEGDEPDCSTVYRSLDGRFHRVHSLCGEGIIPPAGYRKVFAVRKMIVGRLVAIHLPYESEKK
jgi:hypothetical protein